MKQLDSRRLLAGLSTALSTATVLVIAHGLLRLQMTPLFAFVLALLSLAAGGALVWRCGPEIFGPRPPAPEPVPATRPYLVLGGIALAAYAFLFIPLWYRPDISWDAMAYHLPAIQFWAQKGRVYWVGSHDGFDPAWTTNFIDPLINGYPKGAETIGFLLSYLTGGHLANAWNFFYMPLGILGIYVGARELGAGRIPALFAGTLFAIVPVNVSQLTCAYVDTGYAAAICAFFALALVYVRRLLRGEAVPWPLMIVAGQNLGLALGIKPPATMATVVSLGVLGLVVLAVARAKPRGERRPLLLLHAGRLGALLAVALVVGGYWYARNWDYRGNPLFPVEVKVAGKQIFPGTPLELQITMDGVTPDYIKKWSTPKQVAYSWIQTGHLEYPPDAIAEHTEKGYSKAVDDPRVKVPAWPRTIRYQDSRIGGLGFAWVLAALPAATVFLLALGRRWRRTREREDLADLVAFGAVTAIVAVCFLGSPLKWWARYTIWIEVPGFIALGVLLHQAHQSRVPRWTQEIVRAAAVAVSVVTWLEYGYSLKWAASVPYFVGPPQLHATANPAAILRAVTTTEDSGCGAVFHYMPPGLVREAMCSATTVAISPLSLPNAPALGQLSAPPGARRVISAPTWIGVDPVAARDFIAQHRPRYVVWDPAAGPPPALEAIAARKQWLYGLIIMELGNEPPPPLLLPKP